VVIPTKADEKGRATPTSLVSKSDDIRVRRLPVVNRAKRFVGILSIGRNLSIGNVATLASHGALARH
jgi:hypothetical protein